MIRGQTKQYATIHPRVCLRPVLHHCHTSFVLHLHLVLPIFLYRRAIVRLYL